MKNLLLLGVSIAAIGLADAASAQTAPVEDDSVSAPENAGLEEITVTATRRARSANDVSIAISAMSEERIGDLKIESGLDVAKVTPGLFVSNAAAGQSLQYTIRGVTQSDFSDIFEGPIAVYYDDTYIPFLQGQVFGTFDMERIEVLKGPQGTQFGKNATGGLVHFIPKQPTQDLNGYMSLEYGRFDKVRGEAAISGGLSENISARLSLMYDRNSPYIKNVYPTGDLAHVFPPLRDQSKPFGQDQGFQETVGARLQLKGEFGDRLTVRLTGSVVSADMGTSPETSRDLTPIFNQFGQHVNTVFNPPGVPNFIGTLAPASPRTTSADFARRKLNFSDSYDVSAHIEYDFGGMKLNSISSYKHFKKDLVFDLDGGPANLFAGLSKNNSDSFSQELRLSGNLGDTEISTGLFYVTSVGHLKAGILGPGGSGFAGAVAGFSGQFGLATEGVDLLNVSRFKNTDYSGYVQADIPIAEKLTLSAGARLIHTEQEFDFVSHGFRNTNDFAGETDVIVLPNWQPPYSNKRNKTLWAGKAVLEYRPNSDLLIYGGYNRGVKAGAYNGKFPDFAPPLTPAEIAYQPETLHAYEGGFKADLFGRRLNLTGAAYYYNYKGYQTFTLSNASGIIFNNNAKTYGFEVSADFLLGNDFRGALSYSYTHAEVKDVQIAPAQNGGPAIHANVRPGFSPRHQATGNLIYTYPGDVFGGKVSARLVGSYISDFFDNIRNFDAQRIQGYFIADAGLKWKSNNGLEIGVDVKNLFNKSYVETSFDISTVCGCAQTFYSKPRWWSIRIAKSF